MCLKWVADSGRFRLVRLFEQQISKKTANEKRYLHKLCAAEIDKFIAFISSILFISEKNPATNILFHWGTENKLIVSSFKQTKMQQFSTENVRNL